MAKGKNKSLSIGIVEAAVPIPRGEGEDPILIYVRGFSPNDFSALLRMDVASDLRALYKELAVETKDVAQIEAVGIKAISGMPPLMAKIIAQAAGLPEDWEEVLDWTIGAQLDCVVKIVELTFASESVAKKLGAMVRQFLEDGNVASLPKPSTTGSGSSAET